MSELDNINLSDEITKDLIYPDYIENQPDSVKKVWERWYKVTKKIENHPKRFYTCILPHNQEVKVFDLKNTKGFLMHLLKKYGVSKEDIEAIHKQREDIYELQKKKVSLRAEWSRDVFKGKNVKGDDKAFLLKKHEIIELFGSYYSLHEVYKKMAEWGFATSVNNLQKFYLDNEATIKLKRAEYLTKKNELRLSTDTGRLEVLTNIVNDHLERFNKEKSLALSREIRALIEQIRKEVKGEEIRLTFDGKIDINATIAANKAMNEVFSKLPINLVVIGLTAAKIGVNPTILMNQLATSYYSKWNGFSKLEAIDKLELPGRFIKNYDWNEIERMHSNDDNLFDEIEEADSEDITEQVDYFEFKQKKSNLLDMLNDYKQRIKK